MLTADRIREIERWCEGWEKAIDPSNLAALPLSVALGFVAELLAERKEEVGDASARARVERSLS